MCAINRNINDAILYVCDQDDVNKEIKIRSRQINDTHVTFYFILNNDKSLSIRYPLILFEYPSEKTKEDLLNELLSLLHGLRS